MPGRSRAGAAAVPQQDPTAVGSCCWGRALEEARIEEVEEVEEEARVEEVERSTPSRLGPAPSGAAFGQGC